MSAPARAELIADGGRAASSEDLFRAPAFLAAEQTTHTLRIASRDRVTLLPLVVREIPESELRDAVSPYAYPGGRVDGTGPVPDPAAVDWSSTGLVSVFVRERLGDPVLASPTERALVQVHDPSRERSVRPRLAGQIRAAEREGWRVEALAGREAGPAEIEAFERAYEQTMRRTAAAERYFFGRAYYEAVLSVSSTWLFLGRGPEDEPGAAAIAGVSDGFLHYFLGGTTDASLDASPFKCVVWAMLELADELGMPLNLGGGAKPGDGLERFKRGFANRALPFFTHELICDSEAYERLSGGREASEFFPAYRAP